MKETLSVMYVDTAYTLRQVRRGRHESFFFARHASNFFDYVCSVHPLADLVEESGYKITLAHLSSTHLVIEGKVELLNWPRALKPLNFLISQVKLYCVLSRLIRRHSISMIMAADPFYSSLLGLALAGHHRKPFGIRLAANSDEIYRATGALAMPRLLPSYALQRLVQRFVLRRADLVAGINRNNLGFGIANGARGETRIVPFSSNIAEVHRLPPEERGDRAALLRRLRLPTDSPILVYVGRLLNLKHPDDAVRVMAYNIRRNPRAVGVIVGAGPMEAELRELARDLGVEGSIRFLGQLDQQVLSLLVPHCIMLSPSAGQLALLECSLGEAAIVAYDRDFQSEFIQDGVNGLKVAFRDVAAMSAAAERLINDRVLAKRLSAEARRSGLREVDPCRVRELEWEAFGSILPEGLAHKQRAARDMPPLIPV